MNRTPRLRIFTGNRLELLSDRLCDELQAAPLPPARREQVVVPSRGMGAWLERQVALRWGIAASIDFPFPARFVDRLAERFELGRPEPRDPFRPAAQLFELHEIFWQIQKGEFEAAELKPVTDHLGGDHDGRKRYQLARRLGGLFAKYQFARPAEIARWRRGDWFSDAGPDLPGGEPWQRLLFNRLADRHAPDLPPSARILELLRRLDREVDPVLLPERLSVFGASTLPPVIAQVFVALSRHVPVDFYLLSPTEDYLGDLRARRQRDEEELAVDLSPAQELVAELGQLGREFFDVIIDLDPSGGAVEPAGYEDPGSGSVLHHLQSALLHGTRPPADFAPDDRSLRLHSCHSPMREMEVLRDEVLAALADGTADSVSDVLLLVPDIRTYAPFARSVFGAEIDNDGRRIRLPIRVADRSGATDQPYARLVLAWLELAAARLTLSEVFAVLQEEVVCAKFDFAPDDLDALRDRLAEAGVIWGVDPDRRAAHTGTPRFEGVSWREGLDRLLLGCFTGALDEFVGGVLPAADAAVGDTELLGDLATALDALFSLLEQLDTERPIDEWVQLLVGGLDRLTDTPDERTSIERARCVEVLTRIAADADGSSAPVGRLALIDLLGRDFEAMEAGGGLIGGAITVAELRPMRSLPARVIAVAGMDAESFPRRDPSDGLDLAGEHKRRKGDRSPRDDDRQLFLELLLCARERLILSWVGRDQRDDHERTLSPCAQEVVDTLEELGFADHTVEHALQPFASVDCHESTYDEAAVRAAEAMADVQPVARFVDTALDPPARSEVEAISLADLRAFWRSPSAWFCRRAAAIAMAWEREEEEAEALGLDGLQAWRLRDAALAEPDLLADERRLLTRFGLPANPLVAQDLRALRDEFAAFEAGEFSPVEVRPETVEVEGPDFVVRGRVPRHADGRLVELVAGSVRPKGKVQALVGHAMAGCAGWPGPSLFGSVRTPGKLESWDHFADPYAVLAALVAGYRAGLESPLPFYPQTTFAFARALGSGLEPAVAFATREVQKAWAYAPDPSETFADEGDCFDEAVALCTRGLGADELCDERFVEWARNLSDWCEEIGAKL